ncbi:unnamed protein product [Effrenium voratum]|nr:unnamed protein product [Effrenium voratum]
MLCPGSKILVSVALLSLLSAVAALDDSQVWTSPDAKKASQGTPWDGPALDASQASSAQVFDFASDKEMEEQVENTQNICISMMLLGCMGFMMSNFYLVNWPDEDIKRISWEVISSTVSIFSAVLLFQACNKVVEYYILDGMWIWYQLVVDMVHMLLWFCALQLVLAYLSGAMGTHADVEKKRRSSFKLLEGPLTPRAKLERQKSEIAHMKAVKINTVCWSTLLGHVTGFAAINAWGTLQQAVPRNLIWCSAVPALAVGGIYCIYQGTDYLRKTKTMADGDEDEFEALWGEEVAETEDDVLSLAVSFLVVQVLRFLITGNLPNTEGEDPEGMTHSTLSCELLLLAGLVFGCFDTARIVLRKFLSGKDQKEPEAVLTTHSTHSFELDENHRAAAWFRDIAAMCTAWCLHFSVDWWLSSNLMGEGAVLSVICAVAVTGLALGLIFVLDKLADMDFTDDEVDCSLRALITSLGILIGFSWERSFDAAVGGLAENRVFGLPPPILTLILAIILASMVMPAWKWYILPVVEANKEESHNRGDHHAASVADLLKLAHSHQDEENVSTTNLNEPLLKGHQPEGEQDADHSHARSQEAMEAVTRRLAELEVQNAEKDRSLAEAQRNLAELEMLRTKQGATHAEVADKFRAQLQERDRQLQEHVVKAKVAEDSAKGLSAELELLRRSQGDRGSLVNQLQANSAELRGQVKQLEEELAKARAAAAEKHALAIQWEQRANEAGQRAELDRTSRMQAQQSPQKGLSEELKARTAHLQQELAKATQEVNHTANRLGNLEKENRLLREEVNRLKRESTTRPTPQIWKGHASQPQSGPERRWSVNVTSPHTAAAPQRDPTSAQVSRAGTPQRPAFKPAAFASPYLRVSQPVTHSASAPSRSSLPLSPTKREASRVAPPTGSPQPWTGGQV